MPRRKGAGGRDRALLEEIDQIDRSILLLVDARDRAFAQVAGAQRSSSDRSRGTDRGEVDMVRGWAAEVGIAEPVAVRVAHWLIREGVRARGEASAANPASTTTCVVVHPERDAVGGPSDRRLGARASVTT